MEPTGGETQTDVGHKRRRRLSDPTDAEACEAGFPNAASVTMRDTRATRRVRRLTPSLTNTEIPRDGDAAVRSRGGLIVKPAATEMCANASMQRDGHHAAEPPQCWRAFHGTSSGGSGVPRWKEAAAWRRRRAAVVASTLPLPLPLERDVSSPLPPHDDCGGDGDPKPSATASDSGYSGTLNETQQHRCCALHTGVRISVLSVPFLHVLRLPGTVVPATV